jgi:RimK-like ATP-grasp domain
MQTIVLLTEDNSNRSVNLIAQAIFNLCQDGGVSLTTMIIEKKEGDGLILNRDYLMTDTSNLFPTIIIPLKDIAFVMLRTWTDKREPVITLSQELQNHGICIADSELMPWTLSKILQYRTLQNANIFPKSFCLDHDWMSSYKTKDKHEIIQQVTAEVNKLHYPVIIKTSRGSRGTGVYRASTEAGLKEFLSDYLWGAISTPEQTKRHGLIFQKFIPPNTSVTLDRSIYLRVNIVNNEICSVLQFELGWRPLVLDEESKAYDKIEDQIADACDTPLNLEPSLINWYRNLQPLLPFSLGVVGLDIMMDEDGNYFLLEVNCGPIVSLIEELGEIHPDTESGKACMKFSYQIASFCIQQALEHQKSMTEESITEKITSI